MLHDTGNLLVFQLIAPSLPLGNRHPESYPAASFTARSMKPRNSWRSITDGEGSNCIAV